MNNFINNCLQKFKEKKIPNPELDIRLLLSFASKKRKNIFLNNLDINDIDLEFFNSLILKRLADQPVSKITNKKSFWKSEFFVNFDVMDPRPETELIIEEVLNIYENKNKKFKILDIGTGSGCISISLAKEFPNSNITAIDISKKALQVANKNIVLNNVSTQVKTKLGSLDDINDYYDVIVTNPPYLSEYEYNKVQPEIKKYEPKIALIANDNGYSFYKSFSKKIENIMKKNSYFIFEIGNNQLDECIKIFNNTNLKLKKISKDIQKIDRTLTFVKI